MLECVRQQRPQHKNVGNFGELRRAHPKVGLHGLRQCGVVFIDQRTDAQQAVPPQGQGHVHLRAAGAVLGVKEQAELGGFRQAGVHPRDDRAGSGVRGQCKA